MKTVLLTRNRLRISALALAALAVPLAAQAALVVHLPFEGSASDISGTGNNGSILGGASFGSGVIGQALSVANGGGTENQGVNVPASASLSSNVFTLAYWIMPTALQGNAGLERLTSREGDAFETAIGDRNAVGGAADPLTLSYYQTTGWHSTGTAVPLNEWTHVAWRNNGPGGSDMNLLINGVSVFSGPGVPGGGPSSGFMNIGTRHNNVEGFEGMMDDFRLYDSALSDGEIAALVPEPSAATLALLAVGAVGLRRRRK
ncbi:MAG: LamG-like jellyroll fold domain-containing protein [Verrucomicrobiales bacterium]